MDRCGDGLGREPWNGRVRKGRGPFYVSGSVGGYFRQSDSESTETSRLDAPGIAIPISNKRDFSSGILGNAALGYRLNSHIRFEMEFDYTGYRGKKVSPLTSEPGFPGLNGQSYTHTSGDNFSRIGGTANAFYDFSAIAGRYTPYVGIGVGGVQTRASAGLFTNANGVTFGTPGGSSTEGVAMVEGGFSVAIAPHLSLVPAYRFVDYFSKGQDVAHVVKIGLRYAF